jgi:hypothetical protein
MECSFSCCQPGWGSYCKGRTDWLTDHCMCTAVCRLCPAGVRSADAGALGSASLLLQAGAGLPPAAAMPASTASRQLQQHPRLLASTMSCPPGGAAAAAAAAGPDGNVSGSCIVSQPVNTSAIFSSSTQQLLSGSHSAPHGLLQVRLSVQGVKGKAKSALKADLILILHVRSSPLPVSAVVAAAPISSARLCQIVSGCCSAPARSGAVFLWAPGSVVQIVRACQ